MIMKKRTISFLLIGVAMLLLATAAVVKDICIYIDGGRPWSATIDGICGIFFHAKRNNLLARVPVCGNQTRMTVSHKWRGSYQFRLWIPDAIEGFISAAETIGMDCVFYDKNGVIVYANRTPPSINSLWSMVARDGSKGSDLAFRMYSAPDDVPLDEELTVKVRFRGQFEKFFVAHSNACLVLVKERDK